MTRNLANYVASRAFGCFSMQERIVNYVLKFQCFEVKEHLLPKLYLNMTAAAIKSACHCHAFQQWPAVVVMNIMQKKRHPGQAELKFPWNL